MDDVDDHSQARLYPNELPADNLALTHFLTQSSRCHDAILTSKRKEGKRFFCVLLEAFFQHYDDNSLNKIPMFDVDDDVCYLQV